MKNVRFISMVGATILLVSASTDFDHAYDHPHIHADYPIGDGFTGHGAGMSTTITPAGTGYVVLTEIKPPSD